MQRGYSPTRTKTCFTYNTNTWGYMREHAHDKGLYKSTEFKGLTRKNSKLWSRLSAVGQAPATTSCIVPWVIMQSALEVVRHGSKVLFLFFLELWLLLYALCHIFGTPHSVALSHTRYAGQTYIETHSQDEFSLNDLIYKLQKTSEAFTHHAV